MRILVRKTEILCWSLVICSWSLGGLVCAQDSQPSAPTAPAEPNPDPVKAANTAKETEKGTGSSSSSAMDYLFNRKPQEGSAAKEVMEAQSRGKAKFIAQEALGGGRIEDPAMRNRFEKYLGMAEVTPDQLKSYESDSNKVVQLLRGGKTTEAWKELYKLAEYQNIDAGVSLELANRIESIWNADRTSSQLDKKNEQLRREIDSANRNADMMSNEIRQDEIEFQKKMRSGGGSKQQPANNGGSPNGGVPSTTQETSGSTASSNVNSVLGKLELTEEYLNSLEKKARIKLNELKSEKLFDKAKDDFALYITTLYDSGRQRHVLIAADFWRKIFDQGDYPVSMAQQVNASLEMSRDVQNNIDVFNHRLEEKEISAATDRLQEAFMLNELHPSVLGLPRAKKKEVEGFTRRLSRMQNMLEARDFSSLETLLEEMKKMAPDFDTTKPLAIINAVKLESQLRLGKAKLAAQSGDLKMAMEEFQTAAETWPGNPDLKDKALTFFNSQDMQTQSLTEFDRLVTENNYRGIFDKQLMFAPAMKDDTKRQEQLKAALEKVKGAEIAIEKANLLRANGDVFGAWEAVELAVKDLPMDIKLNTLRGDLSGKGAEFVSAINKAKEAEAQKMLGYSLTWYAIAQRQYPASQIANQGIERISQEIVSKSAL